MMKSLWKLPWSFSGGPEQRFAELLQRTCALEFDYTNSAGGKEKYSLLFHGTEAFKCTYMHALTLEMIEGAYDRLVDMGNSHWLKEVAKAVRQESDAFELSHFRICFDDGPCYEFISRGYEVKIEN